MPKHRGNKTPCAYAWVFAEQLLKNPRREFILTGIYANNQKLKYGGCRLGSEVLISNPHNQ